MQYLLTLLALGATTAFAQAPPGCSSSFSGAFSFQTANITSGGKRARSLDEVLERRQQSCGSSVTITLNNGQLVDSRGRVGYIASNDQFQFDDPIQAGALTDGPFYICADGTLSLGPDSTFYNCLSGTFFNIYNKDDAAQCNPVTVDTFPCEPSGSIITTPTAGPVSQFGLASDLAHVSFTGKVSAATSQASSSPTTASAASVSSFSTSVAKTSAAGVTSAAATPFPVAGNGTAIATGTAPGAVTTAHGVSPITSATPSTSAFKGAASVLAVGQGFVALVAAAGAFFIL